MHPKKYDPHKTRDNRWSDKGVFAEIMAGLAAEHNEEKIVMIDASYLKAHRTATSMGVRKKGEEASPSDRLHQGEYEPLPGRALRCNGPRGTKLHAVCKSQGRPISLFVTAAQGSDDIGARALLRGLANVNSSLGDCGCDANWFSDPLEDKGVSACVHGTKKRGTAVKYNKRRNSSKIMFGRLKDWCCVATRYDRCPKVILSAIALAATVIHWL